MAEEERMLEGGRLMARSYYVEVTCVSSAVARDLENHLEAVMDALQSEPGIEDADIGANLEDGTVEFCLHLDADDSPDALRQAHLRVRSALHAAGGATPGWDQMIQAILDDDAATTVRPSELLSCC
ncbi:hypothetical protein [Lentzea sp. NPDC060358]|uniref:hypothetical protein n=1 Tax=Lentzea sp. NPDC060358 TaxID=3347103 RepID=UPI0036680DA6